MQVKSGVGVQSKAPRNEDDQSGETAVLVRTLVRTSAQTVPKAPDDEQAAHPKHAEILTKHGTNINDVVQKHAPRGGECGELGEPVTLKRVTDTPAYNIFKSGQTSRAYSPLP